MEYNKQQFAKSADRKKLHKVKKQWVVISTALLMALGGGVLATHVSAAHADNTNNQNNNQNSLSNSTSKSAAPQLSVKSSAAQSKASNGSNQSSLIMNQAKSLHSQILNAGLQNHTNSSASAVQRRSGSNSKSAVSSASQNTSTSSKAAQSSVKQSKSGSNAVQKVVSSADKLGADANTTNNDMIVKYFNQHGKQIGYTDKIAGQKSGNSIDVTNPSQGGEVVPRGYKLDPGMIPNQTFTDKNQIINLELIGDQITSDNDNGKNKVTVYVTKNSSDGSTPNKVSDFINGRVGDTVAIDPGKYLPSGYYANSGDHDVDVTIQPDGSLSGLPSNVVKFGYTKNDTQLKKLNKIYMNYVDRDHIQNGDIQGSTLSDANMTGQPFSSDDLKEYEDLTPKGYYSLHKVLPGEKIPTKFAGVTQEITFLVAKDDDINYVNQSDGSLLKTIYLNRNHMHNSDVNYDVFAKQAPTGYHAVGAKGTWDSTFKSGGVNTVLVRRNNQYGQITVNYVDENNKNHVVGHVAKTEKTGSPFNVSQYTTASDIDQYTNTNSDSPVSYKYDRVLNYVNAYAQDPQTVNVGVTEVKKQVPSDDTGVATITYKDISDKQPIGKAQTIKNKIGTPMTVYYEALASQDQIQHNVNDIVGNGADYVLAEDPTKDSNNDQKLEDRDQDTIWVKKAAKQVVKSKITVDYAYKGGLVGSDTANGNSGTGFSPITYAKAHVPSDYSFVSILSGAGINQFTDQPQTIIAAVNKNQAPVTQGTVNIHFMYNGQQMGSHQVISDVGHAFNIQNYENAQDGMPSGYKVTNVNPAINQIPKGTTDEDVILNKLQAAKGTVNIDFMYNGQQLGHDSVTSDAGRPFNVGDYEKVSDGMPSGYSVASVTPNIAVIPKGTETETVNLKKNVVPAAKGTVNIDFMYNNQRLGHDTVTSDVGHSFDITNYEKASDGMPDGYSVASVTPNITAFTNTPQNETVNLKRNIVPAAKGTINIDFMYNGQQLGHDSVTSDAGRPFNVSDYEKVSDGMPSGYSVANVTPNITVIPKGTETETVNLKKNPNPVTIGTIGIHYFINGSSAGNYFVNGTVGSPFNLSNYLNAADKMPQGYSVASYTPHVTEFTNQLQNIYVNLKKNSNDVTDTIQFRHGDSDNSTLVNAIHPKGEKGQSFDVSSQVPSQYNVHSNTKFTFDGGTHIVYVGVSRPNGNNVVPVTPVNSQATDTIQFRHGDEANSTLVKTIHLKGVKGQSVDVSSQVPSQYNVHSNTKFTFDGGTHVVYVGVSRPNGNKVVPVTPINPQEQGTINVYFNDKGIVSGPHSVTGNVGDSFNIANYENAADGMPANTHVVNVENNTNKFTKGTWNVYVDVANNNQNQIGTIDIYFEDNGQMYGPHAVSGVVGTPFNIANYENVADGMPANTHVTKVMFNTDHFNNGTYNVYVNVAGNNNGGNTPSSSNNPSSNTPASNSVPSSNNTPSSNSASSSAPSSNNTPSSNSASSSAPSSDNTPSDNTPSSSAPNSDNGGGNNYSNHHDNQSTPSNSGNGNQNYSNNPSQSNNSGNSLKNRIVGNNSRNTSRRLAQTGEASNYDVQIAGILVTLGMALSALGYAIDRKHRDY